MLRFIGLRLGTLVRLVRARRSLLLENLALRQQLAVLKRRHPRPNPDTIPGRVSGRSGSYRTSAPKARFVANYRRLEDQRCSAMHFVCNIEGLSRSLNMRLEEFEGASRSISNSFRHGTLT